MVNFAADEYQFSTAICRNFYFLLNRREVVRIPSISQVFFPEFPQTFSATREPSPNLSTLRNKNTGICSIMTKLKIGGRLKMTFPSTFSGNLWPLKLR